MNKRDNFIALDKTETLLSPREIKSLYEYVERRDEGEPGFRASIATMYEHNARWSNPAIRLVVWAAALMLAPRNGTVKYFFWGNKFQEIILGLPRQEVCVIGGPKQLIFCLKHRIPFLANMHLWKLLALGLQNNHHHSGYIKKLIEKNGLDLKKKASHEAALIVDNDSLPMQRAIILAGRIAHLKSACIQDGIFQGKSPGHIMHGWFADQFLAINEHQKQMLTAKGMDAQKIKVMGFHSSPYRPKRPTAPPGQRKICFLGQPWNKYGQERLDRYMDIISKTAAVLRAAGIEMSFKPHPWERGSDHLKLIANVVDIPLHDAFEEYDVFISLTSTALIEAQAAGRVAIQIMDDQFDADDLSVHGKISVIDVATDDNYQARLLIALSAPVSPPDNIPSAATRLNSALQ
jgi:hypothetical protein